MPWVTFTKDFDWSPAVNHGRHTIAFKAGTKKLVTRECAEEAEKAGAVETHESR